MVEAIVFAVQRDPGIRVVALRVAEVVDDRVRHPGIVGEVVLRGAKCDDFARRRVAVFENQPGDNDVLARELQAGLAGDDHLARFLGSQLNGIVRQALALQLELHVGPCPVRQDNPVARLQRRGGRVEFIDVPDELSVDALVLCAGCERQDQYQGSAAQSRDLKHGFLSR